MAKCKNCINLDRKGWCEKVIDSPEPNHETECYYFQTMTNADRIRAMTDEELAKYIIVMAKDDYCDRHNCTGRPCWQCRLEWLKKEVDG